MLVAESCTGLKLSVGYLKTHDLSASLMTVALKI
jgi:hypothetical protein